MKISSVLKLVEKKDIVLTSIYMTVCQLMTGGRGCYEFR